MSGVKNGRYYTAVRVPKSPACLLPLLNYCREGRRSAQRVQPVREYVRTPLPMFSPRSTHVSLGRGVCTIPASPARAETPPGLVPVSRPVPTSICFAWGTSSASRPGNREAHAYMSIHDTRRYSSSSSIPGAAQKLRHSEYSTKERQLCGNLHSAVTKRRRS